MSGVWDFVVGVCGIFVVVGGIVGDMVSHIGVEIGVIKVHCVVFIGRGRVGNRIDVGRPILVLVRRVIGRVPVGKSCNGGNVAIGILFVIFAICNILLNIGQNWMKLGWVG